MRWRESRVDETRVCFEFLLSNQDHEIVAICTYSLYMCMYSMYMYMYLDWIVLSLLLDSILDHCGDFSPSKEDADTINNCLLILRNIFHISDESNKRTQDDILKVIFKDGFRDLYIR